MSSPATPIHIHSMNSPSVNRLARKRLSKRLSSGILVAQPLEEQNHELEEIDRRRNQLRRRSGLLSKTSSLGSNSADKDTRNEPRWTKDQLLQHYSQCIKLSQENKINHKNAFDLQLIEHMGEMILKDGALNFRVAGGAIFAGAKIYASRVDAIHSDIYRVLSSLGSGDKEDDDDVGDDGSNGENEPRKKKRKKHSKILETNEANLRLNAINTCPAVDGTDRQHGSAIDAASCDSFKLNYTPLCSDSTSLQFDSETIRLDVDPDSVSQDLVPVLWDLHLSKQQPLAVTASLSETIEMTGSINVASETREDKMSVDQSRNESEESPDDFSCAAADDDDGDIFENHNSDVDDGGAMEESVFPSSPAKTGSNLFEETINPERLVALAPGEYSYFQPKSVLSIFDGPQHWLRHKSARAASQRKSETNTGEVADADTAVKKKRKKAEEKVFINRKCIETNKKLQPQRCSKQKLDAFRTNHALYILAENDKQKRDSILGGKVLKIVIKKLTKEMIQFAGVTISNGDEIISDFNYANDDYCPANTESDYEDCNDEQTRIGFPNCTVGDSVLPDFTQSSQMYDDGGNYNDLLEGDHLVSQPRKVEKINLAFAKRAKRIDVKRLKGAMWSLIAKPAESAEKTDPPLDGVVTDGGTEESTTGGSEANKEVVPPTQEMNTTTSNSELVTFSDLYRNLPGQMSESLSENLSVPLAFTCLLHLANEKQLKITDNPSLSDLQITVGL